MDRKQLRAAVFGVIDELDRLGYPLPESLKRRDPREPGRDLKESVEDRLQMIIRRYFKRQQARIVERLEQYFPQRKDIGDLPPIPIDDIISGEDDDELMADLIRVIGLATRGGVNLFKESITIGFDYTAVNEEALSFARDYSYELINKNKGGIDQKTRDTVSTSLQRFIDTPGLTLGDIASDLSDIFGVDRARMIAVTETTRAFAEGNKIAGQALAKEFPDVEVVKTFFTNVDDRVCDLCSPLDGLEVDINEDFPGGYGKPPIHPNCRCWTSVSTRI